MIELILGVIGLAFIGTGIGFWPEGWPAIVVGVLAIAFAGYQMARRTRSTGTEGE